MYIFYPSQFPCNYLAIMCALKVLNLIGNEHL